MYEIFLLAVTMIYTFFIAILSVSCIGDKNYLKIKSKPLSIRIKDRSFRHVNILNWLPQYTKEDGIGDMIAGITVGLTMMPQSIAYASLAGLSPQVRVSADLVPKPNSYFLKDDSLCYTVIVGAWEMTFTREKFVSDIAEHNYLS
jgi:hypothetical protein